jgi:hypothetical protein
MPRLVPRSLRPPPGAHDRWWQPSPITLATLPSGIKVFDATSADQATAWLQGGTPVSAPQMRPVTLTPSGADPLAGVNPALGDPDDPTPPILIVVQTPAIPGLTVLP